MFCKNCGKEIADDSKFCSFCGTSTESEDAVLNNVHENEKKETDENKHLCPSCGSDNLKIERQKFGKEFGCSFLMSIFILSIFPPLLIIPVAVLICKLLSPGKKVYVCQNCGEEWDVEEKNSLTGADKIVFKGLVIFFTLAIIVIVFGIFR